MEELSITAYGGRAMVFSNQIESKSVTSQADGSPALC